MRRSINFSDNPILDFEQYSYLQEKELLTRPICYDCGERIQDEQAYHLYDGEWVCEDCIQKYLETIEDL